MTHNPMMPMFPPIRDVPGWLMDIDAKHDICPEARIAIQSDDPNRWWRLSQRGDWMLYGLLLLITSRQTHADRGDRHLAAVNIMEEISEYVECPRPLGGLWIWNSSRPFQYCSPADLTNLADRVRELYPDAPLSA